MPKLSKYQQFSQLTLNKLRVILSKQLQQNAKSNKTIQQRMKDYHIEDFVNSFITLMELSQPKISTIIHLDYTAFPTAKQIWLQNIHDRGQESIELRNKAQQLMRVLQEDQHQHAGSKYVHWQAVKDRNENKNKEQEIMKRQQRASKLRQCKQPGLEIKVEKQQREVKKSKKSQKLIFRDENIDSSNLSQSNQFHSKHDITRKPGLSWTHEQKDKTTIVELKKKQYLKQVPKHESIKEKYRKQQKSGCCQEDQMQLNSKKEHYQANCLHIKYQCCCKNRNSQSFHDGTKKMKIRQFLLQESEEAQNNQGNKLGRQNQIMKCNRQEQTNQKNVLIYQTEFQENNLFDQNKSQNTKRINNRQSSSNHQAGVLRQFHYDKRTVQSRKQQMEERNKPDRQNVRARERSKQVMDYQKYSKLRFEEKMRNMQTQRQLQMKKQMETEKRQYQQLQQKRRMAERRQEQKRRENSLLNRLKEEFSEICNKEPASEEKRISEQIQQLEMKLNQIIAHDKSSKNHVQSQSINAKVVRLNLTPSRNNLHKNTGIPRSPTSRSPVVQKTQRLLSKRIQNAVKN